MIQLVVRDGLLFGCTTQQLAPGLPRGRSSERDRCNLDLVSTVLDPHPGHSPFVQDRFRADVYNRIFNAENYGWFTWRSFEGPFAF